MKKKPELIPFVVDNKKNQKKTNYNAKLKDKSLNHENKIANKENFIVKPHKNNNFLTEDNLNKYRVQLGSFKNKKRALKAMKNIELKYAKFFKNIKLEIFTFKKEDYIIHRVWTNLMKKNLGLNLCKDLKKNKVNCILHVEGN